MSESEVSLPQKYIDLTEGATSRWDVKKKLMKMVESLALAKVTSNDAGDYGSGLLKSGDGIYLADMRNLDKVDMVALRQGLSLDLVDFKKKYENDFFRVESADREYSTIVFIKVIEVAVGGRVGPNGTDKKPIFKFYAYHPNGDFIGECSREVSSANKHQSAITEPAPCVYELPVDVLKSHNVILYKPDIPETPVPVPVAVAEAESVSSVGGGKKLRSAKKTSKRRSVKSKTRHYRRSVGSINRHRKKTTRRRR